MGEKFARDAKVLSKGQVTIPKEVREVLGVKPGDKVTFIVEDGTVKIINSVLSAIQKFQVQTKDESGNFQT